MTQDEAVVKLLKYAIADLILASQDPDSNTGDDELAYYVAANLAPLLKGLKL